MAVSFTLPKGAPKPLDPKTAPLPKSASASQVRTFRKLSSRNAVMSLRMSKGILLVTILPAWEMKYAWGEGRTFVREIEKDGTWFQVGLRPRPDDRGKMTPHARDTFRPAPVKVPAKASPKKGEAKGKSTQRALKTA
jgi:hypothetical protein